jgi:hypothetical protein
VECMTLIKGRTQLAKDKPQLSSTGADALQGLANRSALVVEHAVVSLRRISYERSH